MALALVLVGGAAFSARGQILTLRLPLILLLILVALAVKSKRTGASQQCTRVRNRKMIGRGTRWMGRLVHINKSFGMSEIRS